METVAKFKVGQEVRRKQALDTTPHPIKRILWDGKQFTYDFVGNNVAYASACIPESELEIAPIKSVTCLEGVKIEVQFQKEVYIGRYFRTVSGLEFFREGSYNRQRDAMALHPSIRFHHSGDFKEGDFVQTLDNSKIQILKILD